MIAVAMSAFNLSGLLCAPIHAMTISKMGRKNAIIFGILLVLISNTCMGLISLLDKDDWKLFFGLSFFIRFVQGYGDSLTMTTGFSVISS